MASGSEIKAAYKQRALAWHPDKHDSAELKARAEEQFKLLGDALAVLGEPLPKQCVRRLPVSAPRFPSLHTRSAANTIYLSTYTTTNLSFDVYFVVYTHCM